MSARSGRSTPTASWVERFGDHRHALAEAVALDDLGRGLRDQLHLLAGADQAGAGARRHHREQAGAGADLQHVGGRPDRAPDGGVVGAVARGVVHHAEVPGPHLAGVELAQEGLDLEIARPQRQRATQGADGGIHLLQVAIGKRARQQRLQVVAGAGDRLVDLADGGPSRCR